MLTSTFFGLASIVKEFISHRGPGILQCIEQHLDGFSIKILNIMMPSVRLTLSYCGSPVPRKPFTHSQFSCPRMVIAIGQLQTR
jgi:hypothetical protein